MGVAVNLFIWIEAHRSIRLSDKYPHHHGNTLYTHSLYSQLAWQQCDKRDVLKKTSTCKSKHSWNEQLLFACHRIVAIALEKSVPC